MESGDREKLDVIVVDVFSDKNDIIVELSLPREDLAVGKKGSFLIQRRVACEKCDGSGCADCEAGNAKVEASVDIDVPAGAGAGMQIRLPKQGHHRRGTTEGDVIVVLGAKADDGVSPAAAIAKSPATMLLYLFMIVVVFVILFMFAR